MLVRSWINSGHKKSRYPKERPFSARRTWQNLAGPHAKAFWFTSLLALVSFVFTYFSVPETKGRSREEFEAEIRGR